MASAREYVSAAALAALRLVGMPTSERRILARAQAEQWAWRPRFGRGGGREYCVATLPAPVRAALAAREAEHAAGVVALPAPSTPAIERYAAAPPKVRARADRAVQALNYLGNLLEAGERATAAVARTARDFGLSEATIARYRATVAGHPMSEWIGLLLPKYATGARGSWTELEEAVYLRVRALKLHAPRGSLQECYRQVVGSIEFAGAQVPSLARVARRFQQEPALARHFAAFGDEGIRNIVPHPRRHLRDVVVYGELTVDGSELNWQTALPGGKAMRLTLITFQDVRSRAIVGAKLAKSESIADTLLCAGAMCRRYGLPDHVRSDNGRAFSSPIVSGGGSGRKRWSGVPDEVAGVFTRLGVSWGFATVKNGRAKPVERAFGTLNTTFEVDERLRGAWIGRSPHLRPHTYRGDVVPYELTLAVVLDAIARYNETPGRRGGVANGASYQAVFEEGWQARRARGEIPIATPAQLEQFWLLSETVKVRRDCTVHVFGTAFHDVNLLGHVGKRVLVRYHPHESLQLGVRIETPTGEVLGRAQPLGETSYRSAADAERVGRLQREHRKAARELWRRMIEAAGSHPSIEYRSTGNLLDRATLALQAGVPLPGEVAATPTRVAPARLADDRQGAHIDDLYDLLADDGELEAPLERPPQSAVG
jgi:hypothetical protein